ncbi:hypothetical protein Taro_010124 [Colocasia esculenta]|uniref:RING-type domain-containing protein n=1 Tax=Colocasia esculenta TaxID=4460 RepID=A0A843U2E6_COLES|nr:hypothetical protein [Colocasia esculenta]
MGFPSIFSCVLAPKPLAVLVVLLDRVRLLVSAPLFYLGFYFAGDVLHTLLPPFADPAASDGGDHAYRLSAADLPAVAPLLPAATSSIKRRLRVVQFHKLAAATPPAGLGVNEAEGRKEKGEEEEHVCAVCLCGLAAGDEVRELGNCRHAFHRRCIDRWVDQGRLTCPLCRARLLPRRWERRESWVAESISYLLGDELRGGEGRRC